MRASISFSELNQLLSRKGIKAVLSSGNENNSFRVNYSLKILFVKKDISATINLAGYTSSTINLKFVLYGLGPMENMAKDIIKNKLPNYVTMVGGNELKVNIGNIYALNRTGIKLVLNKLAIDDAGFMIDANI